MLSSYREQQDKEEWFCPLDGACKGSRARKHTCFSPCSPVLHHSRDLNSRGAKIGSFQSFAHSSDRHCDYHNGKSTPPRLYVAESDELTCPTTLRPPVHSLAGFSGLPGSYGALARFAAMGQSWLVLLLELHRVGRLEH